MAAFTATNRETNFRVHEEDTYDGYFKGSEPYDGGEFGPALKMAFGIQTDDGEDEVSGLASVPKSGTLGPKSKLRAWVEGIVGHKLAEGEAVDIDKLIGSQCRLVLGIVEKRRDDGSTSRFNKIEKILPARRGKRQADEEVI